MGDEKKAVEVYADSGPGRRRFDFPLSTVLAYEAGREEAAVLSDLERAALNALMAWADAAEDAEAKALNLGTLSACGEPVTSEERQELKRLVELTKARRVAALSAADSLRRARDGEGDGK